MSTSHHPVALRLERHVGPGTRLLTTVMALPLVDGLFPALIIAGAVDSVLGILEVGLLVFGGSATLSVVLAEMSGSRREQVVSILAVGSIIISLAAVEAALAPTIESLLVLETFERFAALVILAIAAKTVSATVGEYLPSPGVIIGFGLLASIDPSNMELVFTTDLSLIIRSTAAAGVGVAFALGAALAGPTLRNLVGLDYFRFGSAVALGVLSLSILGFISDQIPLALAVLAVTALLSIDLGGTSENGTERDDSPDASTNDCDCGHTHTGSTNTDTDRVPGESETESGSGAITDGGRPSELESASEPDTESERVPWL